MPDDSAARQFERLRPDRVTTPSEAEFFLERFSHDVVRQPTHESVSLRLSEREGNLILTGWVFYPATLKALVRLCERVLLPGLEVNVTVLPTMRPAEKKEETPLFGRCARELVGKALPEESGEVVHIWSKGDCVRPLHEFNGFLLCQSETDYLGWVLKEGSGLMATESARGEGLASLRDARSIPWERIASKSINIPYRWGGSGKGGIDCSAFVQRVYSEAGLVIPRDAHQQMLGGRLVSTHDARVPPEGGDLLFFTLEDGRIGHVGLSLGGWRMIHAERPVVGVCSLDPSDPDFNAERHKHFVFAKRLIL